MTSPHLLSRSRSTQIFYLVTLHLWFCPTNCPKRHYNNKAKKSITREAGTFGYLSFLNLFSSKICIFVTSCVLVAPHMWASLAASNLCLSGPRARWVTSSMRSFTLWVSIMNTRGQTASSTSEFFPTTLWQVTNRDMLYKNTCTYMSILQTRTNCLPLGFSFRCTSL